MSRGGEQFSGIESYLVISFWTNSIGLLYAALQSVFGFGLVSGNPFLLLFTIFINGAIIVGSLFVMLTRKGRSKPFRSLHMLVPASAIVLSLLAVLAVLIFC